MKALILNSGLGSRMGDLTSDHPKCMTVLKDEETILSRQLRMLADEGITDVVITTGYKEDVLVNYCKSLDIPVNISFVYNDRFSETNYIYSIYLARRELDDDLILMHGDLVFDKTVLKEIVTNPDSCMAVSSTALLPQKDFKAVVKDGLIKAVGIEFFDDAVAAQPLYKLRREDFKVWLDEIERFCNDGDTKCYAENAFNKVSDKCTIKPFDVKEKLCNEIDTQTDLEKISELC